MIPRARVAALRALAIDESLGEAHGALGHINICFDWDWPAAEANFRRAIQLSPSNSAAHGFYALPLAIVGRIEAALHEAKIASELEPTSMIIRANSGFILYLARRYREAVEQLQSCVALEPASAYARYRYGLALEQVGRHDDALAQFDVILKLPGAQVHGLAGKGHVLAQLGRDREARDALSRLLALAQDRYVSAYFIAQIHTGLGELDKALDWLEKAYDERPVLMISLMNDPKFDKLRGHARFTSLVQRVGIWKSLN